MQDYPRMLYHEDGRSMAVASAEAEKKAPAGFGRTPHEIHQRSGDIIVPGVGAPSHLIVEKPNG